MPLLSDPLRPGGAGGDGSYALSDRIVVWPLHCYDDGVIQANGGFSRWWLLPVGIITTSVLIALGIVVFKPPLTEELFVKYAPARALSWSGGQLAEDCPGELAKDYPCIQKHYQELVRGSGFRAAFTNLKAEYQANEFIKENCHQFTHVIGRAAADLYGDIPKAYAQGDSFCWSGYYHGAMETIVAKIGPDKILSEAGTICSSLSEEQQYSFDHYNCVHGLGHGFMGILQNDLFKSLETCDALSDEWERESCYSGVFMENTMAGINPDNSTRYLKADEPLYPCTAVDSKYKAECYKMQTSYALRTQDNDFDKVFALCAAVEDEFRPTCYQSLGRDASGYSVSDATSTKSTCMRGQDDEARSNCVIGAVKDFISYYHSDTQAKEFCESFDADLRDTCLKTSKDFYKTYKI